jgi:hypothetical protein
VGVSANAIVSTSSHRPAKKQSLHLSPFTFHLLPFTFHRAKRDHRAIHALDAPLDWQAMELDFGTRTEAVALDRHLSA